MEVFSLFATMTLRAEGFFGGLERAMRMGAEFERQLRRMTAVGGQMMDGISEGISAGTPALSRMMEDIVRMCARVLGTDRIGLIVSAGNNVLPALMRGIQQNTANSRNEMDSIGRNLMDSMSGGITSAAQKAVDSAKRVAQSIADTVKGTLGINSPSRVFMEIGSNVGEGFVRGLEAVSPEIDRALGDVFGVGGNKTEILRPVQDDSGGKAEVVGGTVVNQYFYGVREEKTAFEAYRAVKKCY